MIPTLAVIPLRLPPLVHMMWVHPIGGWPLESAAVIGSQALAILALIGCSFHRIRVVWWSVLEALHLGVWIALEMTSNGAAAPAGGFTHALIMFILACRIQASKGKYPL